MSLPCEIAVKGVLPPIRAMLAKELTSKQGFKQEQAAKLLGLSQPAISLYYRKIRGTAINLENDVRIKGLIEDFAGSLARGKMQRRDFILKFCEICRTLRKKGLLCEMHRGFDPTFRPEECQVCLATGTLTCP